MGGIFDAQLETQGGHQESQEHRATVAHENFGGLKIPTQESGGGSEDRGSQDGDQRLLVKVGEKREEHRGHGGNAGTQAVHVIKNTERSSDAHHPENRQSNIQEFAAAASQ